MWIIHGGDTMTPSIRSFNKQHRTMPRHGIALPLHVSKRAGGNINHHPSALLPIIYEETGISKKTLGCLLETSRSQSPHRIMERPVWRCVNHLITRKPVLFTGLSSFLLGKRFYSMSYSSDESPWEKSQVFPTGVVA